MSFLIGDVSRIATRSQQPIELEKMHVAMFTTCKMMK